MGSKKVSFVYKGRRRFVEPYSTRMSTQGNKLLYATEDGATKSFDVSKLKGFKVLEESFEPIYPVEISHQAVQGIKRSKGR